MHKGRNVNVFCQDKIRRRLPHSDGGGMCRTPKSVQQDDHPAALTRVGIKRKMIRFFRSPTHTFERPAQHFVRDEGRVGWEFLSYEAADNGLTGSPVDVKIGIMATTILRSGSSKNIG